MNMLTLKLSWEYVKNKYNQKFPTPKEVLLVSKAL